jgi:hypothetical protein
MVASVFGYLNKQHLAGVSIYKNGLDYHAGHEELQRHRARFGSGIGAYS